ncbi:hypothetical protein B0188_02835 [[Haemophilus] felis]|uniref:Uncharacterized protein n=1 Tax=[Haemophilus] felis TaxID=123822 RepID=A0A1T0B844_9PAST|nr:hypothetical protein B0188_02835 [[Haemophilus] felis]
MEFHFNNQQAKLLQLHPVRKAFIKKLLNFFRFLDQDRIFMRFTPLYISHFSTTLESLFQVKVRCLLAEFHRKKHEFVEKKTQFIRDYMLFFPQYFFLKGNFQS